MTYMKRVLITGKTGYIASSLRSYLQIFPEEYETKAISLRDNQWRRMSFSGYDAVVHCAGLAHIRETAENAHLYYKINRDLTITVAEQARAAGVRQFIFLSSLSVYGMDEGVITPLTKERPKSAYGISKYQAEVEVRAMESETFRVVILRPPMVYGPDCKGNYQVLVKLAGILPTVPAYVNRRSAVSVDRLCECIKQIIVNNAHGLFVPQDANYLCTCAEISRLAVRNGRRISADRHLNMFPVLLRRYTAPGRKAFGDLIYME